LTPGQTARTNRTICHPCYGSLCRCQDSARRHGASNTTTRGLVLKTEPVGLCTRLTLRSGSTETNDQPPHLALRPGTSVSECRLSTHASPCGQATLQVNCRHPHLALRPGISVSECRPAAHTSPCGQVALPVNCQPLHPALRSGASVGGVGPSRYLTLRPGNDTGQLPIPLASHLAMTGPGLTMDRRPARTLPCGPVALPANPGLHCRRTCWTPIHGSNQGLWRDSGSDAGGPVDTPCLPNESGGQATVLQHRLATVSDWSSRSHGGEPPDDSAWEPN